MDHEIKICSKCHIYKEPEEFYISQGRTRSECKKCTIAKNVRYQRKNQSWKNRYVNGDKTRSYMAEYYDKNRDKFLEYRRKFKDKNPDYHRDYNIRRKYGKRKPRGPHVLED